MILGLVADVIQAAEPATWIGGATAGAAGAGGIGLLVARSFIARLERVEETLAKVREDLAHVAGKLDARA